ncbi:MAG: COX15/CtaA family protein [Bacteroidetes bacterium]|nr:COX15/CtaA family protein [Bacteroidota bacterium]
MVILAGAVVRTTGSGMGCPDWPRCFGNWVPPTDESQLPPDYQTRYRVQGQPIAPFNAAKTWTEYLNRLTGALAGLLVAWMFLQAFRLRRFARGPLLLSAAALIMMGFQAWLGKKVVDSNLKEYMITIHMVVAVLIVFVLLLALRRSFLKPVTHVKPVLPAWGWILQAAVVALSLVQLVLGTQVREQIDAIALEMAYAGRAQWIGRLDTLFYVHRSFSLVLLALGVWAFLLLRRFPGQLRRMVYVKMALLFTMLLSGIILSYWHIPAAIQPVHLLVSIILLAMEFVIFLNLWVQKQRTQSASIQVLAS